MKSQKPKTYRRFGNGWYKNYMVSLKERGIAEHPLVTRSMLPIAEM